MAPILSKTSSHTGEILSYPGLVNKTASQKIYSSVAINPRMYILRRRSKKNTLEFQHMPTKNNMSRVMRKPAFYICENKDTDQLRGIF